MAAAPQAAFPIISQTFIGEFEISVPSLAGQRRIVAELDALLPAILDKAFKCEL